MKKRMEAENRVRVQLKDQYEWNLRERELLLTWTGQEDHERMQMLFVWMARNISSLSPFPQATAKVWI